jgi:hypothetical protein
MKHAWSWTRVVWNRNIICNVFSRLLLRINSKLANVSWPPIKKEENWIYCCVKPSKYEHRALMKWHATASSTQKRKHSQTNMSFRCSFFQANKPMKLFVIYITKTNIWREFHTALIVLHRQWWIFYIIY